MANNTKKLATTIDQTSGGHYQTFTNINNTKKADNTYAQCLIHGKKATLNRPSRLTFKDFRIGLPTGAMATKITVEYKHEKVAYDGKQCNVTAPTIYLMNGNSGMVYGNAKMEKKGQAPTTTAEIDKVSFTHNWKYNELNTSNFGVRLQYPSNANDNDGYIRLYYLRIIVTYKTSAYTVKVNHLGGQYNKELVRINFNISNRNMTNHSPTATITTPMGFSLQDYAISGKGTFTKVNATTYTFVPQFNASTVNMQVTLDLIPDLSYATGVESKDCLFEMYTNLGGGAGSKTVTIYKTKPVDPTVDTDTGGTSYDQDTHYDPVEQPISRVTQNEAFTYTFTIDDDTWDKEIQKIYEYGLTQNWWSGTLQQALTTIKNYFMLVFFNGDTEDGGLSVNHNMQSFKSNGWTDEGIGNYLKYIEDDKTLSFWFRGANMGYDKIYVAFIGGNSTYESYIGDYVGEWSFDIKPLKSSLTVPSASILTLSREEQNRLGHTTPYTLQANLQELNGTIINDNTEYSQIGAGTKTLFEISHLPSNWELTCDFKTNCESRFAIGVKDSFTGSNPNNSIFVGSPAGILKMYYGYRDTTTHATDITADPTTYSTMKIAKNGTTITYTLNGTTYTQTNVTVLENATDFVIGLVAWGATAAEVDVKNIKLTYGSGEEYVRDWYNNFRIGVFNNAIESNIETYTVDGETIKYDPTDYNNLSTSDIINGAEYWSPVPTTAGAMESLECPFVYNKNYPLYILICGDYQEATNPANIRFTEPCIVETAYYKGRVQNGTYPVPIDDLVMNDGSTSEVNITAFNTSDTIVFYKLPLEDDYGTNEEIAIRGLQVNTTFESNTDNLVLYATLVNGQNESKTRSIVLDQQSLSDKDNIISIGQVGDLWGYKTSEIANLEDWEIHLTLNNSLNTDTGQANFGDVNLTLYIENIEHQNVKCLIDGQDISYYGAFITDLKIPEGLKTDTKFIDINGTDTNDPYVQNIREKQIEIEMDIGDCDLEGSTLTLRELTKLLVNKRDEYNKPIPKTIQFSHYPDIYWEYIIEDTIDSEIEISTYKIKAKLTIPAGTAYDKEPTVSSTTGYVSGIAAVRPTIIIQPTEETVSLREDYTDQELNLAANGLTGKYIELDCDNRIALLKEDDDDDEGDDITYIVDWNSDWFTLQEEYAFESIGCNIVSITYQERW